LSVSYRKGRRLEYGVKELLESQGWFVVRAAGSKPVDLVCIRQGQTVLIECKYNKSPTKQELERLAEISKISGARVLLAVRQKYGRLRIYDPFTGETFFPYLPPDK